MLRNRNTLRDTVEKCLDSLMPPTSAMRELVRAIFKSTRLPSASTISKNQALFDAATICLFREMYPLADFNIFVKADASPHRMLGEIFLTEFLLMRKGDAVPAMKRCWELCALKTIPDFPLDVLPDLDSPFFVVLKQRAQLFESIENIFLRHINPLQLLGQGMCSFTHKTRSLVWVFYLLLDDRSHAQLQKARARN